ncbi:response regulator [Variovorax sp. J22R133]|uniref:response regulator n=1 Tax=Variovorax brevis TaxID=3053503 RepID=UPI0025775B70|nr:response regulator [Variovorax sp. J22R133]MDM0112064.1 response regulator [Variovorax sp. J22R133]
MKLRAFLVEDNEIIRNNLTETLYELANVEVVGTAARETDAVEWLGANEDNWSVAIVDLFLLEGSGIGVIAACRDRKPFQKVAVVTNYATAAMRRRCLDCGADAVFDKSTELDALLDYCVATSGAEQAA